jgi:hypothetical protein
MTERQKLIDAFLEAQDVPSRIKALRTAVQSLALSTDSGNQDVSFLVSQVTVQILQFIFIPSIITAISWVVIPVFFDAETLQALEGEIRLTLIVGWITFAVPLAWRCCQSIVSLIRALLRKKA